MHGDKKAYRKELKEWYSEIKRNSRCAICGEDSYLQFHHRNPRRKKETVSRMVHEARPKNEIIKEMKKCVILCRSCHCRVHNQSKKRKKKRKRK